MPEKGRWCCWIGHFDVLALDHGICLGFTDEEGWDMDAATRAGSKREREQGVASACLFCLGASGAGLIVSGSAISRLLLLLATLDE